MKPNRIHTLLLAGLIGLTVAACAAPRGGGLADGRDPTVVAGAAFMEGRMLELNGRLAEAADAYEQAAVADPESAQLQRYLAQIRARMGETDLALEHAERAFAIEPEDEPTRRALAALYIQNGQNAEAVALLEPLFEEGSLTDDGQFALFNLYLRLGDYDAAEQVGDAMIASDPSNLRGYLALGAAFEASDAPAKAERVYRQALEIDPNHPAIYDKLADLRRTQEDPEGELAVLQEKLRALPGDPRALQRMAQIYDDQGDRKKAIVTLEKLVRTEPDHAGALFQLGFFLYQDERYEEAADRFARVIDQAENPDSPLVHEVRYFLGVVYYEDEKQEDAIAVLGEVDPQSERFADARILMARIHEAGEDYPSALRDARMATDAEPDNTAMQVYYSGILQRSGDTDGAIARMQQLVAQNPEDADLFYDLGVIHGESGDEETALVVMAEVLERDPDHASALNYVGYTWADQGERLEEAETMIRRASELRPGDGYITDSLGWVLYQQGLKRLDEGDEAGARESFNEAVSELEKAADLLEEGDPIITRHLGDAYRSVSRFDEALATYERALTLDPKEKDAEAIQREIELLRMQLQGAAPGAAR